MPIRNIVPKSADSLKPAQPVTDFNDPLVKQSIQDLKDTLVAQQQALDKEFPGAGAGVGLASNQIEYPYPDYPKGFAPFDMYVISVRPERAKKEKCKKVGLQVFINVTVNYVLKDNNVEMYEEGCLSVTGIKGIHVPRYKKLVLEAYTEIGEKKILAVADFVARVHQHEMDHCRGQEYLNQMNFNNDELQLILEWATKKIPTKWIIANKLECVSEQPDFDALLAWVKYAMGDSNRNDLSYDKEVGCSSKHFHP